MEQKNKIAVIALLFALLAMAGQVGISGINGTNGTNAAGGEIAYYLHNTSSDIANSKVMNESLVPTPLTSYVNVTNVPNGDTLLMNWTTPSMNITSMPAGVHVLHITVAKTSTGGAHDDYIYYKCATVNATGALVMSHGDSELSAIFLNGIPLDVDLDLISTSLTFNMSDRMFIQVYVRQTGTGNLPDVQLRFDDLTDSRLILPSNAFTSQDIINIVHNNTLSDNLKVNKSGDTMTGSLGIGTPATLTLDVNGSHVSGTGMARFKGKGQYGYVGIDTTLNTDGNTASSGFLIKLAGVLTSQFGAEVYSGEGYTAVIYNRYRDNNNPYIALNSSGIILTKDTYMSKLTDTKNTALCIDANEKVYRSTNATSNYLTC